MNGEGADLIFVIFSPQMYFCGDIGNFSTREEIFNFPTIVIHGKLKFLHMTIFSPLIMLLILVTKIRSGRGGGGILKTVVLMKRLRWVQDCRRHLADTMLSPPLSLSLSVQNLSLKYRQVTCLCHNGYNTRALRLQKLDWKISKFVICCMMQVTKTIVILKNSITCMT